MALLRLALLVLCSLLGNLASAASLDEAERLLNQAQRQAALAQIEAYLAEHPGDPQGRFLKGMALAQMNRQDEAIQVFSGLTEDHPELPEPYNNLAVIYAAQGRYEMARRSLELAILTHPGYATAYENLGDLYTRMAAQAYEKSLRLDQGNAPVQAKAAALKNLIGPDGASASPATAPLKSRPEPPMPQVPRPEQGPAPEPGATAPAAPADQRPAAEQTAVAVPGGTPPAPAQAAPIESVPLSAVQTAAPAQPQAPVPSRPARANDQARVEQALRTWVEDQGLRRGYTKVELSNVVVEIRGEQAEAKCLQRYQSDGVWGWTVKTYKLVREADSWKVVQER